MTLHVSPRFVSRLLLFSIVLLRLPTPATAQSVAPTSTTSAKPTRAERLDRLAAEIDRNRIDLHDPGAALAIVRGDEVIFARGFGVADVKKKTPVLPNTPFFIGSATKAFTATLVGILVDEGRMQWDDPVEKYLPEFKLAVQSKDPNDRATLRDVLSHRTGFTRMGFLETNTGLSSDEILRRASSARLSHHFASGSSTIEAKCSLKTFANYLSGLVGGQTVIDKTGLTGIYEIHFTLNRIPGAGGARGGRSGNSYKPPITDALEDQLGLRLEPRQVPVEYLVVDHMEKPSAN